MSGWLATVLTRPVGENLADLRGTVEHLLEEADESFAARISTRMTAEAPAPGGGGVDGTSTSAAALPIPVAMPNWPPSVELGAEPAGQLALDAGHLALDPGHLALDATAAAAAATTTGAAAAPAPELRAPTSEVRAPSPMPERGVGPSALVAAPATSSGELNEQPAEPVAASTSGLVGTDREAVAASANGPAGTDRERRLQLEVERLRSHIMAREEVFTHEVLQQDAQLQALREELEAVRTRAEPADAGLAESNDATVPGRPRRQDDAERDAQAVANLQSVIEMLQAEHAAQLRDQAEMHAARLKESQRQTLAAQAELADVREQLRMLRQQAEQASTTERQLHAAQAEIARLQAEVVRQQEHLQESMKRLNASYASTDSASVDRRLMCNLVTAYAAEQAAAKKLEILRVIADILGASEDDKQAMGLRKPAGGRGPGGLLGSLFALSPTPSGGRSGRGLSVDGRADVDESFSELWIQFLLNEAHRSGAPTTPAGLVPAASTSSS